MIYKKMTQNLKLSLSHFSHPYFRCETQKEKLNRIKKGKEKWERKTETIKVEKEKHSRFRVQSTTAKTSH